ncbi:MAG TPA: M13 family metallopeptidase [Thermoanaerobaculia bacterium]|nr:M13 family metallopeptidase [Thermoanaerobaculia bacterium]
MKVRSAAALTLLVLAPAVSRAAEVHGIDPADMDLTSKACQNFYLYADGGWLKKNPIPPDYPSWGAFNELEERNREILHQILEKLVSDRVSLSNGSDEQKLSDFYASCMDEKAIDAEGIAPLKAELERIEQVGSPAELQAEIARLQVQGTNAVFAFGSEQDRKNATEVIAAAFQGGLGMPDRDYYVKTDGPSKELRSKYLTHVTKMLELAGDAKGKAAARAKAILALETKLAEASMTRVEQRDPEKTYNKMGPQELAALMPNFSWSAYFKDLGMPSLPAVNIGQPKFFEAVNRLMRDVPLEDWKTYLRWKLVAAAAPSLSSKFVDQDFDFNGRILQGTPENLPRWKRCVASTDNALGMALGRIYVRDNFPPESKKRADEMVRNLIAALRTDIPTLSWMSEATKKAALEKLSAFDQKIGYPARWRDYTALTIGRGPYVTNVLNATAFESRRDLAKIGRPVDRTDWEMTPPTVNAYYNPLRNEIVFPAGILQPPFFDGRADDAVNYGGIGAVIGHEMTHGFDDEGRKFDAQGNLKDWWTPQDASNYEKRAACVEQQFSAYVVEGDLHVNGKLVLGESIADLGGLKLAYDAFRKSLSDKPEPGKIDGLTPDQRFFLGWARVWASNDRPEFARLLTNVNPHPLDRFRAIGAPSNMPEFARAFSCAAGDPMVRSESCAIW